MFTASQVADINLLTEFFSFDQTLGATPARLGDRHRADLLILLGNAVLATAERAFQAFHAGVAPKMLIVGGVGHATDFLYHAVKRHPRYRVVDTAGRSEADILREIGLRFFALPGEHILVENQSTNCGENAKLARRTLQTAGERPRTLILTQDPLMQRRTDAAFRQTWAAEPAVRFINWPTLVPLWAMHGEKAAFADEIAASSWSLARFFSLLLGELPRLRDAPGGYGPRGAGFIAHVEIPAAIETAYSRLAPVLQATYGDRVL